MYFIAGILFAWSTVHVVLTIFMVFVYLRYGRNRDYLAFAVVCGFLVVYFLAQVAHYTSDTIRGIDLPMRLKGAVLPIDAAILLYIAEKRAGVTARTKVLLYLLFGLIAIGIATLSLLGLTFDPSRIIAKRFDFMIGNATLYEYEQTVWGYVQIVVSLIYATLAGLLLAKSVKEDKVARNFFVVGVVVLNVLAIHDILLLTDSIKSVYLVAHGLFVMNLCVLFGFVREAEISRSQLTARTQALKQVSINLNRATKETRRLRPMADLGRLSASLAHEIRNPLAVLSNVASSLRHHNAQERDASKVGPLITMMQEETDRLARLVDDLLLFSQTSRVSNGTVDVPHLVAVALKDVVRLYENSAKPEIVTEVDGELPSINGNQDNLRRALTNLIANAFQSSQGSGTVRVIACQKEEHPHTVLVGVIDDAGGVPIEHQTEIFDPFFSTRPTGTGLGLPIAKSIAEAHLGSLVFENRPGEGAGFWLCLPISKRTNEIENIEPSAKAQSG